MAASELQTEVNRIVVAFLSRITELARSATRQMVNRALEMSPTPARRKRKRPNHAPDSLALFIAEHFKRGTRPRLVELLSTFEREYIARALARHGGNITYAANELGVARQALQRKMKRLAVRRRRLRNQRRPK